MTGRESFYAQWGLISVFWILITLAALLEASAFSPFGLEYSWRPVLMQWLPWILLTPLVMWLTSRFPLERSTWHRNLWVHLLACLIIVGGLGTLLYVTGTSWQNDFFHPMVLRSGTNVPPRMTNFSAGPMWAGGQALDWPRPGPNGGPPPNQWGWPSWSTNWSSITPQNQSFFGLFRTGPPAAEIIMVMSTLQLPTFWAVLGMAHALLFYRRVKDRERRGVELEARVNQARLQTLRMQINPHFLFNTLNSISSLVYDQPRTADEMIGSLSDLLRLTLNTSHRQEITLREELDFLGQYLFIEQTRFGDRLKVEKDIEPAALDAIVPNLILQPIVENAFKHGIEARLGPGVIQISAQRAGEALLLEITDNGRGLAKAAGGRVAEGVGLTNTRARLRGLYRDDASLEYGPRPEGGFRVAVQIPWRTEPNSTPGFTVAKP